MGARWWPVVATALLGAQLVAGLGGSALVRAPCVSAIARGLGCNRRAPCPVLSLDDGSDAVAEGGDEPAASEAPARTRGGIGIMRRVRRRFHRAAVDTDNASGEASSDLDLAKADALLKGVSQDIDRALQQRRRRLNARLGTSLDQFRDELLDEVELQASEAKERRQRLRERQLDIAESLVALRQDLLDEIEVGLTGVKRGGRALERGLRRMRDTWEAEISELISEAEAEIDLAVNEIDEAIQRSRDQLHPSLSPSPSPSLSPSLALTSRRQRDEWRTRIGTFERQWREQGLLLGSVNASIAAPFDTERYAVETAEIRQRVADLQELLDDISGEVEQDLATFKQRWEVTTSKVGPLLAQRPKTAPSPCMPMHLTVLGGCISQVEALPAQLPKIRSLSDARMYVADTIFAGDVPALLTRPRLARRSDRAMRNRSTSPNDGQLERSKRFAERAKRLADERSDPKRSDPLGLRQAG